MSSPATSHPPERLPDRLPDRLPVADLRRWQAAWRHNRGLRSRPAPDGCLAAEVGTPGRPVDYLVLEADQHPRRIDTAAGAALGVPDAWVAVPTLDAGRTVDRLREHRLRIRSDSERLMSVVLEDQRRVGLPAGYDATVASGPDGRMRIRVLDAQGASAATGEAAVVDGLAVPDRIETSPDHRRLGLGGAVMTLLAAAARASGAWRGLLLASEQGGLLYDRLGWTRHETMVIAVNE